MGGILRDKSALLNYCLLLFSIKCIIKVGGSAEADSVGLEVGLNLDESFENCELVKECSNYERYTSNYVQDWTLIPCSTSTYKNYLIENDSKICEKSQSNVR